MRRPGLTAQHAGVLLAAVIAATTVVASGQRSSTGTYFPPARRVAEKRARSRRARQGQARGGDRFCPRARESRHKGSGGGDCEPVPVRISLQHAHRTDTAACSLEWTDHPPRCGRRGMGRHRPRRHDVQRHQDVSLHRGGRCIRSRTNPLGDGSRRTLHARGRRPVHLGAQRADHLGAPPAADERLVGHAVGKTGLGRSSAARPDAGAVGEA